MKRVLVLDAYQRSALAVVRSLGKRGIPLVTADEAPTALAGASRYSERHASYPSPSTNSKEFISAVANLCEQENIQIILPLTELTSTLLLRQRSMFPGVIIPFPEISIIDTLSDKCSLLKLAHSLDIPVPLTLNADNVKINADKLGTMTYPIVLKPGKSWLEYNGEWIHTSVRFASCASEVNQILDTDPAFHAHPFMLQECITGRGEGVFAVYDHGKPQAFFAHRRLREKPPHGGVSVLSESIEINPTLLSYARSLLDHVGWHGAAMVEFKVSEDDTPYLMEINTRFWGSLQLAVDSGMDFPWLLYKVACGDDIDPIVHYKVGKRLRWILGDLDSLYLTVRDQQYSVVEKISAVLRFLTPDPFRTRHEVDRWDDLGPFWWELKQYIRDVL